MQHLTIVYTGVPCLVAGVSLVFWWIATRRLSVARQLIAKHEQDNELDRQRIRAVLERGESALADANAQVRAREAECYELRQQLEQLEIEQTETIEQLEAEQKQHGRLVKDHQSLREQLTKAMLSVTELQTERRRHEESKRTLAALRAEASRAQRDLADTQQQLASSASELAEKERQLTSRQAEVTKLKADLAGANSRVSALKPLQDKSTRLESRVTELESELAKVMQLAGDTSAAELDREELQVRLETAAYSARLASKEANRFRSRSEQLENELEALKKDLAAANLQAQQSDRLASEKRALTEAQQQHALRLATLQNQLSETGRALRDAESRAAEATSALRAARRQAQDAEAEQQRLAAQVQTLSQHSERVEQMSAELERLSQVEQKRRDADSEIVRLKAKLQQAQLATRAESSDAVREQLNRAQQALREEQQSHLEAEQRLLTVQAELRAVQNAGSGAFGRRAELEQLERLRDENYKLRSEAERLRVHENATHELEQLTAEHKRMRLNSELLTRRVNELNSAQIELEQLRREVSEQAAALTEAQQTRERVQQLEAQLYALGQTPQSSPGWSSKASIEIGSRVREIEERLAPMLVESRLRSVVLADATGFPVVVTGDAAVHEGLAAFSSLLGELGNRAQQLLPLGNVLLLNLEDANHVTVSCRLFCLGQEAFAIAAIGSQWLDIQHADALVAALRESTPGTLSASDEKHDS